MTATAETTSYAVEGRLLEVCTCNVLCPCWVGEDPDGDGTCDAIMGWYVDRGRVERASTSPTDACACPCTSRGTCWPELAGRAAGRRPLHAGAAAIAARPVLRPARGPDRGPGRPRPRGRGRRAGTDRLRRRRRPGSHRDRGRGRGPDGTVPGRDRAEHHAARLGVLPPSLDRRRSWRRPTGSAATAAGMGCPCRGHGAQRRPELVPVLGLTWPPLRPATGRRARTGRDPALAVWIAGGSVLDPRRRARPRRRRLVLHAAWPRSGRPGGCPAQRPPPSPPGW